MEAISAIGARDDVENTNWNMVRISGAAEAGMELVDVAAPL